MKATLRATVIKGKEGRLALEVYAGPELGLESGAFLCRRAGKPRDWHFARDIAGGVSTKFQVCPVFPSRDSVVKFNVGDLVEIEVGPEDVKARDEAGPRYAFAKIVAVIKTAAQIKEEEENKKKRFDELQKLVSLWINRQWDEIIAHWEAHKIAPRSSLIDYPRVIEDMKAKKIGQLSLSGLRVLIGGLYSGKPTLAYRDAYEYLKVR